MKTFASAAVIAFMLGGPALAADVNPVTNPGSGVNSESNQLGSQIDAEAKADSGITAESGMMDKQMGAQTEARAEGKLEADAGMKAETKAEQRAGLDQGAGMQNANWSEDEAVVRHVQSQLKEMGYDVGPVDGIYGPQTREALIAFQQDEGFDATGEIDRNVVAVMRLDTLPQTAGIPDDPVLSDEIDTGKAIETPANEGFNTQIPGEPTGGFK